MQQYDYGVALPKRSNPAWVAQQIRAALAIHRQIAVIARQRALKRIAGQLDLELPGAGTYRAALEEYHFLNGAVVSFLQPDHLDGQSNAYDQVIVDRGIPDERYFKMRLERV